MNSAAKQPRARRMVVRLIRRLILLILVIVLLPYLIAPLYRYVEPVSTLMIWRWVTGQQVDRIVTPLSAMAPVLPRTVIVAEDARFCQHGGVDWAALQDVIEDAGDGGPVRGASTITQQTAKNLFLWSSQSYLRKALELPLAMWIERVLPKRRVMEIYLNIAEWGPDGQFGAAAGARYAFGRPVRDVTPRQAALLAAMLPNPHRRSARQPGPGMRRLAALYERRAAAAPSLDNCIDADRRGASP
jgi:monofunctional biosynthetic peptidoglycan transglycosylase